MKDKLVKSGYLLLCSLLLYIWLWVSHVYFNKHRILPWIICIIILIGMEMLYYFKLQGSPKVFLPVIIILVTVFVYPFFLKGTQVYQLLQDAIIKLYNLQNKTRYVNGQKNILFWGRVIILIRLVLFTPLFMNLFSVMKKVNENEE